MHLAATLEKHGITWEQLIDVAILCGTDFNPGVDGVGPKTALRAVADHGDLWGALEAEGWQVANADRVRSLFRDPPVTTAYDLDLDVDPDVDAARAYVIEEWEVDADEVERGFERLEAELVQTGLDRWT
jgi:flap endonuclease-1